MISDNNNMEHEKSEKSETLIMDDVSRDIFYKLMHKPGLNFNSLWNKEKIESNRFAYYLKKLVSKSYVEKKDDGYYLSEKGKEHAVFLEGTDASKPKRPLVCAGALVFDDDGNVLSHRRNKEPFFGYCGFGAGGKVEYGDKISDTVLKELKEETNLIADIELKGIYNMVTYNEDKTVNYHHVHYMYKGTNSKGELIPNEREGFFEWMPIEEAKKLKLFPDMIKVLNDMFDDKFHVVELERFMQNGEFVGCNIIYEIKM